MTLQFTEGYDLHGNLTDAIAKWGTGFNGGGGFSFSGGFSLVTGRFGTQKAASYAAAGFSGTTFGPWLQHNFPGTFTTFFFGGAFQFLNLGSSSQFIQFRDSAGNTQLTMSLDGTLHPIIQRGALGSTTIATSSSALTLNTWYYLEFSFTINSSSGACTIRVDEQTTATFSGNTQATALANIQQVYVGQNTAGQTSAGVQWQADDIYMLDNSGSVNNTFLGDIRAIGQTPSGAGTNTNWSRFGTATTNWQAVNEIGPNGDTTYVFSPNNGTIDTYTYASLPTSVSRVNAVVAQPVARRDDSGNRTLGCRVRSGGSEADSPTTEVVGITYQAYQHIMETNPVTTNPWTVSDVNAVEIGPEVVA